MPLAKNVIGGGFSGGQISALLGDAGTVAAAGSVQGDATLLGYAINLVTAADGTKGVILPAGGPGDSVEVFNNAGSTLKVWPPTGAAIAVAGTGVGSANAAFSQLTYKMTRYLCYSGTQWFAVTTA